MILKGKAGSLGPHIPRFFLELSNTRERTGVRIEDGIKMGKKNSHLVVHKSFQAANDLMLVTAIVASARRRHNQ